MDDPISEDSLVEAAATQLSADGCWWWDGQAWVPAVSPDGLWRWDGAAWHPAAALDASSPASLVADLERLLEVRFVEAGQVLAMRAHEWRARDPELSELVQRAAPLAARLAALDGQLAGLDAPGGMLNFRHLLGGGEREQLDAEARAVEAELRPLAAAIGRAAPQPSLKEADEIAVAAHRLEAQLAELTEAVAGEHRVAEEQEAAVDAARRRLEEARARRDLALAGLEETARAREAEHARAVADLGQALRRVRIPGPGAELARFEGVVLREDRVDTPDGRGPLEGASARVAPAAELWQSARAVVDRLGLLEAAHASRFQDALVAGGNALYLLVETEQATSLVPVPEGREAEARRFASELKRAAGRAPERRATWQAEVGAAEGALEAAIADVAAVEAARAALEAAAADAGLNRPVEEAEAELARISTPTPEREAARERVDAIAARILEPPPPLG
jgi:hypothetical protein